MPPLRSACWAVLAFWLVCTPALLASTREQSLALVSSDPQVGAWVEQALHRRYSTILLYGSLVEAQAAAAGPEGARVAVLVEAERSRIQQDIYGTSVPACQLSATVRAVELATGRTLFPLSAEGLGTDCKAAINKVLPGITDDLLRRLDGYWQGATPEKEDFLWVELPDLWSDLARKGLIETLLRIPGIKKIDPQSDAHLLKLSIYREPRPLAREINALDAVTVTRFAGRRVVVRDLARVGTPTPDEEGEKSLPPVPRLGGKSGAIASQAGRKWALVVGISQFQDVTIPQLSYPAKDARAFAATLVHPDVGRFTKEETIVLLDSEATTRRIKMELDYLARMTQPEDLFVFFVSTHAVPGEYDTAGDPYFVTHDSEQQELYATAFQMSDLVEALLKRIRAQTVVGFLDACYTGQIGGRGGDLVDGSQPAPEDSRGGFRLSWTREWNEIGAKGWDGGSVPAGEPAGSSAKRLVLISSSDGDQPSWESDDLGYGFFTYYLIEALRESRGQMTIGSLFASLERKVRGAVLTEKAKRQEPKLFTTRDADFAIGYGYPPEE